MIDQKPNIAVIGSGYWGKNIVRNYSQLSVLIFICDSNDWLPELMEPLHKRSPQLSAYLSFYDE